MLWSLDACQPPRDNPAAINVAERLAIDRWTHHYFDVDTFGHYDHGMIGDEGRGFCVADDSVVVACVVGFAGHRGTLRSWNDRRRTDRALKERDSTTRSVRHDPNGRFNLNGRAESGGSPP